MTRDLSASETTHAEADRAESVHLLEVVFLDTSTDPNTEDPLRLTDAAEDLQVTHDFDGDGVDETHTFIAAGDLLELGGAEERADPGQGLRLKMTGLDNAVITKFTSREFRGQQLWLWKAKLDPATGDASDVVLLHRGMQLSDYVFKERAGEDDQPGTATIETKSASRLKALQRRNAVQTNIVSHDAMLDRLGLSTGNTYFQNVPRLPGRVFWGSEEPDRATDGSNSGGSAGTGGGGGGGAPPTGGGGGGPRSPS